MADPVGNYLRELDGNLSRWLTPVVKWLVYLCVGVALVMIFIPYEIIGLFGARADTAIFHLWIWQFLTYALVHGGFSHLLFNLLALWMFGTRLEMTWGSDRFLRFVIVVSAGAVATHMIVTLFTGQINVPIIGISGVVYGILLVYAMYYPDEMVFFYFLIPIKVKYFVVILGALAFLSSLGPQTGVAHMTHLGGLLFGYLFYKFPNIFDRLPVRWPGRSRRRNW
ncbi:MAG: rhomboid family intramembrane serine protease [bacterium]|nr:rhomboid family intramembrane serine protease [Candidatus Sumerlaeota bacterium]